MTLKAKVLDQLRAKTDWPDYLFKDGKTLDALVTDLDKCLTPVIGGQMQDDPPKKPGSSKVGGVPDVPKGFAWPSEGSANDDDEDEDEDDDDAGDGGPLTFVCQINLAELPADAGLPKTGMLYLFSIADSDRAYGYEIDDTTAKLIYTTETKLSPASPPDEVEALEERAVVLGSALLPEDRYEGHPVKRRFDMSIEEAIGEAIEASGGTPVGTIRMLGNAHFFRSELRPLFDSEKQVLLMKVSGYNVSQDHFGEGDFQIVIDRAALKKGDLGQASVVFEPGS